MRLTFVIVFVISFLGACIVNPIDIENEIICDAESFVGVWEYHSTNGVKMDSLLDIIIELSDDDSRGDLVINNSHYYLNTEVGCSTENKSSIGETIYELKSKNELLLKSTIFGFLGYSYLFKRKE